MSAVQQSWGGVSTGPGKGLWSEVALASPLTDCLVLRRLETLF